MAEEQKLSNSAAGLPLRKSHFMRKGNWRRRPAIAFKASLYLVGKLSASKVKQESTISRKMTETVGRMNVRGSCVQK